MFFFLIIFLNSIINDFFDFCSAFKVLLINKHQTHAFGIGFKGEIRKRHAKRKSREKNKIKLSLLFVLTM